MLGRQAVDNIIVAQEMVHSIQSFINQKRITEALCLSSTLEEAYDKVDWEYVLNT